MADPLFGVSILEEFERHAMHAEDIKKALADLQKRLPAEGIPFALIGAGALEHYGYVRHTEDIDILTTPEGLDRLHERIVGLGILPRAAGLRKALRHTEFKVNIDVIKTGEHAGSQTSPVVYPNPESDAFEDRGGLRIPKLATLILFKLGSGIWGRRMRDLADVISLIQANKLDESFAPKLIPEVRAKYLELLDESRKEKKLEE